jgi:catechol 2,3-dioxygenase-like lactoylglutathione lyase family enzyme
MTIKLTKDSIDLGIVTTNPEAMTAFYRDVLGFEDGGQMSLPGGSMIRLLCGTSVIKLVTNEKPPKTNAPPGGIGGASGYRYWTISVADLPGIVDACEGAGRKIVVPIREIRPGTSIAIVEDPDGNWVEFLAAA